MANYSSRIISGPRGSELERSYSAEFLRLEGGGRRNFKPNFSGKNHSGGVLIKALEEYSGVDLLRSSGVDSGLPGGFDPL